jgi:hypothetical protein
MAIQNVTPPGVVEFAGRCQSQHMKPAPRELLTKVNFYANRWENNWKLYRNYKFCIVMENRVQEAYVTEKLLLAFMGGCVPIYRGPPDVLQMFNTKAFVFWRDDKSTLERIVHLHTNKTAYRQAATAPILADGPNTLHEHFSYSSEDSDGYLQQNIRKMMGIPELQPQSKV